MDWPLRRRRPGRRALDAVTATLRTLEEALGSPVSLQTALMHELHTQRGLVREPRLLSGRELSALRVNAITDPLTGLYNRRFLYDHLQREMSRAERTGGVVSLMMMDLQGFKSINDRLGHPVGDTVLVKTAKVIRDSLRAVDAGCRYGGDEFVAVLPNTTLMEAWPWPSASASASPRSSFPAHRPADGPALRGRHLPVRRPHVRLPDPHLRPAPLRLPPLQLGSAHAAPSPLRGAGPGLRLARGGWRASASSR